MDYQNEMNDPLGDEFCYDPEVKKQVEQYISEGMLSHSKKLTISQSLFLDVLEEYIAYKVFGFTLTENPSNLKFLEESCMRYQEIFPELFV